MKKSFLRVSMMLLAASMALTSCQSFWDDLLGTEDTPSAPTTPTVPGIPSDDVATPNPTLPSAPNTTIPNLNYTVSTESGQTVIRFDLTGIQDPNEVAEWLRLYGTGLSNQNVWLEIDGKAKGFTITNTIDETDGQVAAVDLTFLIDNSGSMYEEADAVARDVQAWAEKLSKTLDIQFGCVGYDGEINGALNITSVDNLSDYLNHGSGTYRTMHFGGDDAATLQSTTETYRTGGGSANECGAAALRYADDNFKFRKGANRVYVNFTDEPNQPAGKEDFSVLYVKEPTNWPATKGTIHTVFSEDSTFYSYSWRDLYDERPWLLSDYTGGTTLFTDASFAGITLDDLPVTGALQNSYYIRITNVGNLFDGQPHTVKITILSPNGTVRAEREFTITFTKE